MPSVIDHYENLLSTHYSWLFGGLEVKGEENRRFFDTHGIKPLRNGVAVDLGCGSGFQSIPLAQHGFRVFAVDLSPTLLAELAANKGNLQIETIQDDVLRFSRHLHDPAELCVCMGDTLTHLDSRATIAALFQQVAENLDRGGTFIITFRDLTVELTDLDRFLLLRSEPTKIFTCYLEYEPERVKVHDLIYQHVDTQWQLKKSYYYKCRVPFTWGKETLLAVGFDLVFATIDKGLVTIIARKK